VGPEVGVRGPSFLAVTNQLQVYSEHSNFLYTHLSKFGMPVDSLGDTNVAVSSWYSYNSQVLLADLVIGWSLFVAAMTKDDRLSSELIARVYNRFTNTTIPATVFPVYYDSDNGTSFQGVAR
jgi:hypothetical protein